MYQRFLACGETECLVIFYDINMHIFFKKNIWVGRPNIIKLKKKIDKKYIFTKIKIISQINTEFIFMQHPTWYEMNRNWLTTELSTNRQL